MSDALIGIVGKDFVLVSCDASSTFSVIMLKDNEDKLIKLDERKILAVSGETGDRIQFTEYVSKNLSLYSYKNGLNLGTHGAAHYIRGELAKYLRKSPYACNMLLAGVDEDEKPSLYYIDYLASLQKVKFGSHGYGSYFVYGILDKFYRKDMEFEEALELMKMCCEEVSKRFVLNSPQFIIKVVDKNGIREVTNVTE